MACEAFGKLAASHEAWKALADHAGTIWHPEGVCDECDRLLVIALAADVPRGTFPPY